jgi:hypothetical protein
MTITTDRTAPSAAILAVAFSLIFFLPSASRAQEAARVDAFGGFSYMRFDSPSIGYSNYTNLFGWNGGATVNIKLKWGVAVDLSGHYGSHLEVYNFLFGPQYTWRKENHRFFVHGLFGKDQTRANLPQPTRPYFESVGRAYGGGGGFDWDYNPRITIRVVQADYLRTDAFGPSQNDIRVSTGLVFHWGHIGHRPKL